MSWTSEHASLKNAKLQPRRLLISANSSSSAAEQGEASTYEWADPTLRLPAQLFHPSHERQPALWRAFLENKDGQIRAVDGIAADWQQQRPGVDSASSSSSNPLLPVVRERLSAVLIQRITTEWLPTLVIVAALEECQAHALHSPKPTRNERAEWGLPAYYSQNTSAEVQEATEKQLEDPTFTVLPGHVTALQLLQRIKHGCSMVWNLYEQQQQPLAAAATTRASRRIAQAQLQQQQQQQDEPEDPTRRWQVLPGGLVATYLQEQLMMMNKNKEEEQKEELKSEVEMDTAQKAEGIKPNSEKEAVVTDNKVDKEETGKAKGSSADENSAEHAGVDDNGSNNNNEEEQAQQTEESDQEEEKTSKEDEDESYHSNEDEPEEDEDEDMDDVVRENIADLEEDLVDNNDTKEDEAAPMEEEDVGDEDIDLVMDDNPYLYISEMALLEWLGRKTAKFLATNELKEPIQALMWTTRKKKTNPAGGTPASPELVDLIPAALWRRIVDAPAVDWDDALLALVGDDWDMENPQVGRTPLTMRIVWGPRFAQERLNEAALAEQQAALRRRQAQSFATWRYKGIGNGCTIWPVWKPDIAVHPVSAEAPTAMLAPEDVPDTMTATRRSRRSEGGVYYGNQSNMTQKQLMDALLRTLSAQPSSAAQLAAAVTDDSTDPVRRIRSALGKLLCKRRQVARMPPQDDIKELPAVRIEGDDDRDEKKILIDYLRQLHETELRLRQMVLKHLTEFPVGIIATSADERAGSLEAMDEDMGLKKEDWQNYGHDWIGKNLFRPPYTSHSDSLVQCQWYRVEAYTEPILGSGFEEDPAEKPQIGNAKEAAAVERRRRFRVVNQNDASTLVLTEAQVFAGFKAAKMELGKVGETPANPFVGANAVDITLVASTSDDERKGIDGTVVGHDTFLDKKNTSHERILVLPQKNNGGAFWARLIFPDSGAIECQIEGNDSTVYTVQQYEYHSSSPAFQECRAIVQFMERHASADPFMEPVDPVALNIPDYFDVIKHPMDISSLATNLENGKYSNIPPKQARGRSPIARMLNGPFRRDVELIFDNAMLFNPRGDWIHDTAASFKKAVLRKIDQATNAAESHLQRSYEKQSIYVDDDSDVDMYEYESDDDYNTGGGNRGRKRKQSTSRVPIKEDSSTRSIERPIRITKLISDQTLKGSLANMPIHTDASTFALPSGWNCRRQAELRAPSSSPVDEVDTELDELLAMHKSLEVENEAGAFNSRRATRGQHAPQSDTTGDGVLGKAALVEFSSKPLEALEGDNPLPCNRLQIEVACERLHEEHFAKLYQKFSKELQITPDEEFTFGVFRDGSFPPYLGRIVPSSSSIGYESTNVRWEIRSAYLIPALRWVFRGLVRSEHLSELEPIDNTLTNGVILPNHIYYIDPAITPFDVVDVKELTRRKRAANEVAAVASSDEEVELSEYEQRRAERVARNADRLKALGLA